MTTRKHHTELVILDLLLKGRRFHGQFLPKLEKVDEFRGEIAEMIFPPQEIKGPVARYPHEPGGGIIGKAGNRPRFQGAKKGVLNHVLGQVETAQAEYPG